ncbi:malto-oligosyltrehalose synthase [Gordonia sp. VNK21]|uniref:malto-oligosyltrehalose synthase n=1 Tax=Gordonia sp. VNK21 TaxID=3382483 RepID=UPI0038D492D7
MPTIPAEPVATYRVQLTDDFTFAEVAGILDDLAGLGISHLYLSPVLEAVPGSNHGYDWLPPPRIAERLGGLDGLRLLREHARGRGIGLILDLVPNHLGVAQPLRNPWWRAVLRDGFGSRYAHYFDLHPVVLEQGGTVIALPYLHDAGDLEALRLDDDGNLHLHEWVLPTAPGTAAPGDDPRAVHERQHYRLVRSDSKAMSYRRFVDIGTLAALRQEDPEVFGATHGWLRELIDEDLVDGVRVDHLDGLREPVHYVRRLRELIGPHRLLYVEKSLTDSEVLDPELPVDGTTGYDQLGLIEGVFTPAPGVVELDEVYRSVTGIPGDGDALAAQGRSLREETLRGYFATRLRWASLSLSATAPDVPLYAVEHAIAAFVIACPVNRPDYPALRGQALAALAALTADLPSAKAGLDALTAVFREPQRSPEALFRVSELTAAVAAKAIEDTGFHRTARLVSSQELGATPRIPSIARSEFHERSGLRARRHPLSLSTLSSHDTKRSGDTRARIAVLAQVPQRWQVLVDTLWRRQSPPDDGTGYLLLQNVVGVWPDSGLPDTRLRDRLADSARITVRHAGVLSSWRDPDPVAEQAVLAWLDGLLTGPNADLIRAFVDIIAPVARAEGLARRAVLLLGPGVGDLYQGSQWQDLSLGDPDNRRPVDYSRPADGPEAQLIRQALAVRRRHADCFGTAGDYRPLTSRGRYATHLLAFARGRAGGPAEVVLAVLRMSRSLPPGEERTLVLLDLPPGDWRDAATGDVHRGAVTGDALFGDRPTAILEAVTG